MRKTLSLIAAVAVSAFVMIGCGEDEPTGPPGGVAGNWSISGTEDATSCGEGVSNIEVDVRIEQSGNSLTVEVEGVDYTGTLNGTQATWSGSYPDDGGTTTEEYTVTFSNQNTSLSGSSTWTWSNGVTSCSGTFQFTGTKN